MPYRGVVGRASRIILATTLLGISGCQSKPSHQVAKKVVTTTALPSFNTEANTNVRPASAIQPASYSNPPSAASHAATPAIELPAPTEELQLELVIQGVLARNPSLQAMAAAWRAAAERYPQVVSLDDPMFGFMIGPAALNSDTGTQGYMLDASQKLPWHGKRDLRGQSADAATAVARADIDETRQRLIATTKIAVADYYLVHRLLELNQKNAAIMREFRDVARVKYENNQVTQEDVLQADVELAELERRTVELQRMNRVAIARINTLLHQQPDFPLARPPAQMSVEGEVPPVEYLRQIALQRRPQLAAEAAKIRGEEAALGLAHVDYYPDYTIVGRYDGFWENPEQRPQVGMNLNVPLNHAKRDAAVREASYRLSQRRAEYRQRVDEVNNDVQSAYEMYQESQKTLQLYESKILPAAKQNVDTARSTYTNAKLDFLRLLDSQRRYLMLQEKYREAEAEKIRRLANLEQAVGGTLEMLVPEEIHPLDQ